MTLYEIWEKNGKKFPFKAKRPKNDSWYNAHYAGYEHLNFTGFTGDHNFKCPENKKAGYLISKGLSNWIFVEEKLQTLQEIYVKGMSFPFTVKNVDLDELYEVFGFDESTKLFQVYDVKVKILMYWHGDLVDVLQYLPGE